MRKVLYIFGQLNDVDIEWLINTGQRQNIPTGSTLITEGHTTQYLYIVLDGELVVSNQIVGTLAHLGVGEMVGEMSFIDANPPSATIKASTNAIVYTLPRDAIMEKITKDEAFAARFYRAIAMFLSDRLRALNSTHNNQVGGVKDDDELDLNVLDNVYLAGQRFDRILRHMLEQ